jgi:hypothetical protein
MRKLIIFVPLFVMYLFVLDAYAAPNANPGDILIVEVNADPSSGGGFGEPENEFVELFNNSGATINLNGWTLDDNGTTTTINLPNIDLEAGKILVVAHANIDFSLYGCPGANTPLSYLPASWFSNNLANTGDNLVLRDDLSTIIDALSYGSDTTVFDPSVPVVFDNSGTSLQRQTYNTDFMDSDTIDDWVASTGIGTPCDVSPTAVSLQSFRANDTNVNTPTIIVLVLLSAITARWVHRSRSHP